MSASDKQSLIERLRVRQKNDEYDAKDSLAGAPTLCKEAADALTAANAKLAEYESVEVPEEPIHERQCASLNTPDRDCDCGRIAEMDLYAHALRDAYRAQAVRLRELERDAERYRWLRDQFKQEEETREWDEHVSTNKRGQKIFETKSEVYFSYTLQEDWRFGGTVATSAETKSFDEVVDAAREA
jgi:hypothetical protein